VIVVDACVLANAVGDDEESGRQARELLREHRELAAPDLVDVETTAVLRRRWLAGTITDERFEQAIEDLTDIPLARFPTLGLMRRAFELRANVTAITGTGKNRSLVFSPTPATRFQIVKLLDDDYLRSVLTDRDYQAGSKVRAGHS
jgi:predicted nucleic acid-binding protein